MKNKNGFTLIEIIVSLTLIALIVTISIVLVNKNSKKEYSEITKNIIRAVSVYIATEKDDNGNTYEYGITHGAKGAQISVKTLYDKGYIDESTLKTLEINYKIEGDKTYLIQVTNSIKKKDDAECKSSGLNYTVNWEKTSDTVYLCPYDENKVTETASFYDLQKCPNDSGATNKFCYYSDDKKYYYVDKVDNNYVSFGKGSETKALWRILYIDKENNEVKLVYDKRISGGSDEDSKYVFIGSFDSPNDYKTIHRTSSDIKRLENDPEQLWRNQIRANNDCSYKVEEVENNIKIKVVCDGCHNDWDDSTRWYHYTNIFDENKKKCENALNSKATKYRNSRAELNSSECISDEVSISNDKINVACGNFTYVYKQQWIQDENTKFTFKNPIYVYYYKPLNEFTDEILSNEEKAKLKNHKFVVNEEKGIFYDDKIGVPTAREYGIITTEYYPYPGYSDVNKIAYFYGNKTDTNYKLFPEGVHYNWTPELTMNFIDSNGTSIKIAPINNLNPPNSDGYNQVYLRPVVVLDLKNLNLSNGDGTKDNPYTIE